VCSVAANFNIFTREKLFDVLRLHVCANIVVYNLACIALPSKMLSDAPALSLDCDRILAYRPLLVPESRDRQSLSLSVYYCISWYFTNVPRSMACSNYIKFSVLVGTVSG